MFLHLENNYEHPLELVSPKILCEALGSIKQVSGKSLFLTVGPSQMCTRKLNGCFCLRICLSGIRIPDVRYSHFLKKYARLLHKLVPDGPKSITHPPFFNM